MEDGLMVRQILRGESRQSVVRNLPAPQGSRLFAKEQSVENLGSAARAVKILNRESSMQVKIRTSKILYRFAVTRLALCGVKALAIKI